MSKINQSENVITSLTPSILRAYDIRGVVGTELNIEDACSIGRAFIQLLRERYNIGDQPKICVGFDGRVTSPEIEEQLVKGLQMSGVDIIRIGLVPTPMLYFAVKTLEADGGIMITASHNPKEYNGFKFMLGRDNFTGNDIAYLGTLIEKQTFHNASGSVAFEDLEEAYLEALTQVISNIQAAENLKVVWDPGNGATGQLVEALCERLPGSHSAINVKIDGSFPSHSPDPSVAKNLEQLIAEVKEQQADIGIALDGDGDRIGVVDGQGRIIWGDQLLIFYAIDLLKDNPGATIIADVKASNSLFSEIARHGGEPLMWKTGHSHIKAKMKETNALLSGEMSGHVFFADRYYGFDDGLYAAMRILAIVANHEGSFTDLVDTLPKTYNTPEIRLTCKEEEKFAIIDKLQASLEAQGKQFSTVDGVRVEEEGGWWIARASNTQNCITLRAEAENAERLAELEAQLMTTMDQLIVN